MWRKIRFKGNSNSKEKRINRRNKQMKTGLIKLLFTIVALVVLFSIIALGNILAEIITIDSIMTVVYIVLGFSFIYLLKN